MGYPWPFFLTFAVNTFKFMFRDWNDCCGPEYPIIDCILVNFRESRFIVQVYGNKGHHKKRVEAVKTELAFLMDKTGHGMTQVCQ